MRTRRAMTTFGRATAAVAAITVIVGLLLLAASGLRTPQSPIGAAASSTLPNALSPVPQADASAPAQTAVSNVAEADYPSLGQAGEPPDSECMTVASEVDRLPQTIESLVILRFPIQLVSVDEIGPSQWNTATRTAPDDVDDVLATDVMRLVRVSVDQTLVGSSRSTETLVVPGGTLGCWKFIPDEMPFDLHRGQRFAIFLGSDHVDVDGVSRVIAIWPIDAGGLVITPADGRLPVPEFAERVEAMKAN